MKKLTREDGSSPDLVAENIDRLREIFCCLSDYLTSHFSRYFWEMNT